MTATPATSAPAPEERSTGTRRTLVGTGLGNALEWYDWGIYGTLTTYLAGAMFAKTDPISAVLATLAVFAVGFAARPLGGLLFGWISDRRGRRFAMSLAVGLAATGSLVIGLVPSYAAIGALASVVLLLARLVQGLAHGGELPSAQTYISEMAPAERRGKWSSLIYVSGTAGTLVGVLMAAILSQTLSKSQMAAFGWRIPFLVGGVLGLYALFMRLRMAESTVFRAAEGEAGAAPRPRLLPEIARNWKKAVQVIGLTAGGTVVAYTWIVFAPAYAISSRHIEPPKALWASVVANLVFIAVLPLWGRLSDRIGRKPVLLIGGIGIGVLYFPLDGFIGDSAVRLAISLTIAMVFIGATLAIAPAVFAELFPTHIRTIGMAVPYSIAVALFGGTAPYLQTWLKANVGPTVFGGYAVALVAVSVLTVLTIRETRGIELHTVGGPAS